VDLAHDGDLEVRQASGLPPPFFIMGCQGSGNSLLALVLDGHSRISVVLGTHFYPLFAPDRHRYGNLRRSSNIERLISDVRDVSTARGGTPPETHEVLAALTEPTFEGVLTAFLHLHARRHGKVRAGERTSQHYLYLREILEGFPESPVIFTIRDPRDTVLTIRDALGSGLDGSIRAWNKAFTSYSQAARPVHLVRYEDLVQRPDATVADVCAFLGERYEPAMLRFFERTPGHLRALPHHRKLFQPIDTAHVGEFRKMPIREIERIEAGCAQGMEALGYAFTTRRRERAAGERPEKRNVRGFLWGRLRYYGWSRERWRLGLLRWRAVLRVRGRYVLMLGFLRRDW
jgi:hypothetical protein